MITTTMHMFPGGQILRSYDLMHWEHCAYVFDRLDDTPAQRLTDGHIYGKGMWAATLRYHAGLFHTIFVCNDTKQSYHYTAERPEGPWTRHAIAGFYHDPSLLFDDDGRVYIAYGNRNIRIVEMEADLSMPKAGGLDRIAVRDGANAALGWEGTHLLKIDGQYYLFCIHWEKKRMRSMGCFRADSLDGEFTGGQFMELDLHGRNAGVAQGGPIQGADGSWYLMLFQDHGAIGRVPVLVPMVWEDGFPRVDTVPEQLYVPSTRPEYNYAPLYTGDPLRNPLSPLWQWNHTPHPEDYQVTEAGLRLTAGCLSSALVDAPNTLTQRCFGPRCEAWITVDGQDMLPGDHAGICALQGHFAHLSLKKEENGYSLCLITKEKGGAAVRASVPWPESAARLRAQFDFDRDEVAFSYWQDGQWRIIGKPHRLFYMLDHFMGCRVGLYQFATKVPGGSAVFSDFDYSAAD